MSAGGGARRVRVAVRTRPTAQFAHDQIKLQDDGKTISVHLGKNDDQMRGFINNKQQDWSFPMDSVLHDASQESVYESCGRDIVVQLMRGYNGTILAYGQTGAGKTYTMCGPPSNYQGRGVIPRAIAQVFTHVRECKEFTYHIHVSYLEIYNEVVYDLLATLPDENDDVTMMSSSKPSSLSIAEDERRGVYVKGLTCRQANSEEEALNMLFEGETNRTIAEHSLNKHSSRSHCIFTITVEARSHTMSGAEYAVSRLNLVDLAGSERLCKTLPSGATEKEAMYINRSLSFLEQVIVALSDHSREHVPFRQSKLTHILRHSLGGNSHTLLIANVWAEVAQIPETLSTLRFASRMKCVPVNPVKNTLKDPQLLAKEYEKEIQILKEELAMHNTLLNRDSVSYEPLSGPEVEEIRQQVDCFLHGTLSDIELVSVRQVKEVFSQFKAIVQSMETSQDTESHHEPSKSPILPSTSKIKRDSKTHSSPAHPELAHTVGESDGTGLGLGIAPASHKHAASPATALKKGKAAGAGKTEAKRKDSKSSSTKRAESPAASLDTNEEEVTPSEVGSHPPRPATPPTKDQAFEEFKKQRGSEINKILLDNKETLHRKKKEAVELSTSVNTIKRKMDELRRRLSESDGAGGGTGDDVESVSGEGGEVVMEEWQFNTLTQLKQLKTSYREQYESLQALQQEVVYCSQYVAQSRAKLVEEFEKWYKAAFIGDTEADRDDTQELPAENEQKEFDKLQAALNEDAPSAFYAAQLRTEKRGYQSGSMQGWRLRPGLVTSTLQN